jgi:hypothetical protein
MQTTNHGTITGYYGTGCRCQDCREAARLYYHERVAVAPTRPCAVDGCPRVIGRRLLLCDGHQKRRRAGLSLEDYTPRATGDDVGYDAAHKRILRSNGPARQRQCVGCGGTAHQWAFIHGSPGSRPAGLKGNGRPHGPYSLNPDHYQPMCASCHKTYDMKTRT